MNPRKCCGLLCGLLLAASPAAETAVDEDPAPPPIARVEVTPAELASPEPATATETPDDKAPVANLFRIPGADAVLAARAAGYCFSPAHGRAPRDGQHTTSSQFGNIVTSEVHGTRMIQSQPPAGWSVPQISNKFYMFVDAKLRPAPLAPGWTIRGIQLKGTGWQWVGKPAAGAPSASFAVSIIGYKTAAASSIVELTSLSLVGPLGATDWRAAFVPARTVQRR